jgi:hypothetical protein
MQPAKVLFVLAAGLAAGSSYALETDQYYAWGRPLADSTDAVNAKFNIELERAIASFPASRPPANCNEISVAYRSRMRFLLLHEIQIWAWNSKFVARIPDGGAEERDYRRTNLYSNHPLIDPGTWMPYTPTIEIAGVRMGTDKLAHFVSSGWTYYAAYRRALDHGETTDQAVRSAIERGLTEERLILGGMTSGVQSIADIEAGSGGLHLYLDLCDIEDPILKLEESGWVVSRPVDLRDYVTPRWDESFQPSVFATGRWGKVRPVLESYCGRLDDPQVVASRRRYRARDRQSVVGEVVAERVAAGKLVDPSQFGIEAVCGGRNPSLGPASMADDPVAMTGTAADPSNLRRAILDEEDQRRRFVLGLVGVQLTYPQVVVGSIAVMATSQPTSYDCTTPCDFRGPFAQIAPGLGGGKLSLGWARVTGKTYENGSLVNAVFIGAAYKVTVLRTWGDLGWVEEGRTYAGFEFDLPVARANLGIGLLYRVDGGAGGRWLVTGGAGWGF